MKNIILIALLITLSSAVNSNLTIHIFKVGQADSQLIIFPSGFNIFIDLGEERDDFSGQNAIYVTSRLAELIPKKTIDVLVLTHIHLDHFGYPTEDTGLKFFIEHSGFTIKKYISRGVGEYNGEKQEDCNENTIDWKYVGENEQYNVDWICYAHSIHSHVNSIREEAQICSTDQINPPDTGATVEIVMTDGYGVLRQDGSPVRANWLNKENHPSENDYSISLKITYGDFVYFTGGDLDGDRDIAYGNEISNAEELIEDIVGEVDIYRVNHHGDYHSSSESFLKKMKPTASIVSCGDNNRYGLPHDPALMRLRDNSNMVYFTENCVPSTTVDMGEKLKIMNDDIIIEVKYGSDTYHVTNKDKSYSVNYNVKKNKPETAQCLFGKDENGSMNLLMLLCVMLFFVVF